MKYKISLFLPFLLLLNCNSLFSQNKEIDSFKLALKDAKHDTTRCEILYQLSLIANDEEWPQYNEQLLKLAQKNVVSNTPLKKIYLPYLAEATNNLGFQAQMGGDLKTALEHYNKSLKIFEVLGDNVGIAPTLNNIATVYEIQGDITKALVYYNKSLQVVTNLGDKQGVASSLYNMGFVYKNQGDIVKALEYNNRSLKIREEIKDQKGVASSLNNIGIIYEDQGDTAKALEYYFKSLKIKKEIGNKEGIATSFNNIGVFYNHTGNYTNALEYQEQALKMREDIGNIEGVANSLNNIGSIYSNLKDFSKALEYNFKSLKIYEEIDDKDGISNALINIGALYLKQKKYTEALTYTTKGMTLSKELGYPERIQNAAEKLNTIYKATGNYKEALYNYEIYIVMRDSVVNQENKKESIRSQFRYEYEKKATADSVKVEEEKKVVAVQLKQEKTQRFALYGGLILVLIFAGFMFNRFRITRKQKHIIEAKEKETQTQNVIITQQKHLVEEKHKEITDSINYAERIQRSFLASKELLDANLVPSLRGTKQSQTTGEIASLPLVARNDENYFVFFKPKDVVSGDFYWASKLSNGNFALAIADSTGHGVPGAIMSLLNVTSLEKAIEHHTNPAEILNHTRLNIIERLKKDGSADGGKDGMDCSLLVFDFDKKQLQLAAANNPVWIIRKRHCEDNSLKQSQTKHEIASLPRNDDTYELIEIKPDKMPVGKSDKQDVPFTLHTIELHKGDTIYALTDGFPDQFGGPNGKKFMSKKLKELLIANNHLPIAEQKQLLETTFKNWVGDLEQVDDVCIIGIKV